MYPLRRLQSVDVGKLDIEQYEVGVKRDDRVHRRGSVGSLADDLEAFDLEQLSCAGPKAAVIIDH